MLPGEGNRKNDDSRAVEAVCSQIAIGELFKSASNEPVSRFKQFVHRALVRVAQRGEQLVPDGVVA